MRHSRKHARKSGSQPTAGRAPLRTASLRLIRGGDSQYVANFLSGDITVIDTTTLMPTHYAPLDSSR